MAWLIVSSDNENGPRIRADRSVMDAQWEFELANKEVILIAGSLRADDGITKNGSVFLLNLPTREDAEAFWNEDPATQAGLRGDTQITWLNVAILDGVEQP